MEYTYTGDADVALLESYRADEEPFPTKPLNFPQCDHRCEEIGLLKQIFFPRCFSAHPLLEERAAVQSRLTQLGELFYRGIRPYSETDPAEMVTAVLDQFPEIRHRLKCDITAAYKGDPAAKTHLEIIRSYPGFHAILLQRVAHELYKQSAGSYARELTEHAKSTTGIDIHPGAEIGDYFFIDHGTGVVIGETTTVGDWVRLYQDVTLGALHFEEDADDEHALRKGYKRHPDIGDHVVIGAGTKVLGAITVGDHVSIGANSWVTENVPDYTKVFVSKHPKQEHKSRD
jgi:serine O-acetyltransferase